MLDKDRKKMLVVFEDYFQVLNPKSANHPIFLKMYHFMFYFMSSLVTWDVVILVLIILKTHVWLRDF